MTRRGLGRGLDALISSTVPDVPAGSRESAPLEVAIGSISPNPYQPRRSMGEEELEELAASIRSHGLIQPLVVAADPSGAAWTLIAGERRLRAAQMAGLATVPIVVRAASDQQMLALAIIENVQRSDLNPIEAAEGYRRLMDGFGMAQAEVADLIGKSRSAVANTVRLLALPDDVQAMVSSGQLSEGHGRALLALSTSDDQRALGRRAIEGGWPVRRMEAEVRAREAESLRPDATGPRNKASAEAQEPPVDPDTRAAARALEEALGTRVEIRRRGSGGQVVVHFYSEEELGALYERLVGVP